jgi:hypothetical protein
MITPSPSRTPLTMILYGTIPEACQALLEPCLQGGECRLRGCNLHSCTPRLKLLLLTVLRSARKGYLPYPSRDETSAKENTAGGGTDRPQSQHTRAATAGQTPRPGACERQCCLPVGGPPSVPGLFTGPGSRELRKGDDPWRRGSPRRCSCPEPSPRGTGPDR